MGPLDAALLVNLIGFAVGIALYGLLGAMVLRHRTAGSAGNNLLLATSVLGLLWNVGELFLRVRSDFKPEASDFPLVQLMSYSALGFLPSVVVGFADEDAPGPHWLPVIAYALSGVAALLHIASYIAGGTVPSISGLQLLTIGALLLAAALVVFNFKQKLEHKAVWAAALLVFAGSTFHLGGSREDSSWLVELFAHQSSLAIVLVILYQNYRFAFADLFLKRALSLIVVALLALVLYIWVAAPLLAFHDTHERYDVQAISTLLVLWIVTALVYPALHGLAVGVVDRVILRRSDLAKLQSEIERQIDQLESVEGVLDSLADRLGTELTAGQAMWETAKESSPDGGRVVVTRGAAVLQIPTAEHPRYRIQLNDLRGGRYILSEEIAVLDHIALSTARRIDALRVIHERWEREFREEEISKLAAEAQLTALRSQINPHFLFNALTTVGYLIQSSPEKAFQTLMQLTKLLRNVLGSTSEFCSLGDELTLIESYLEIERARFEERLTVTISVPDPLKSIQIPSLILQPLVENAIKHGISENKAGGEVTISASVDGSKVDTSKLSLEVKDTGPDKADDKQYSLSPGTGLANIRERLRSYFGNDAQLTVETREREGTVARITLPVSSSQIKYP
jgi:signal transduction histidine kinase